MTRSKRDGSLKPPSQFSKSGMIRAIKQVSPAILLSLAWYLQARLFSRKPPRRPRQASLMTVWSPRRAA
jgi:hypothetical protein